VDAATEPSDQTPPRPTSSSPERCSPNHSRTQLTGTNSRAAKPGSSSQALLPSICGSHVRIRRVNDHSRLHVVEERSRLPTDALRALSHRLDSRRKSVDLGGGWERGVPGDWLDALLGDWRVFDTDALQRRLDALRQQRVEVGGHVVHLVHAEGRGPSPMPLLSRPGPNRSAFSPTGGPGLSWSTCQSLICCLTRLRTAPTPPTRSRSSFRRCPGTGSADRPRPRE
jgi:hypothetical protein